jgi:dTDP-4-amino-4,6-dideoxygalactose transaminase
VTKKLAILGGIPAFNDRIFVTRPVVPTIEEFEPLLKDILETRWLTNDGPYAQEFEKQLEKYLGVAHCSIYCNGTLALQLCVQGLRLSGEVITTPFTFAATPHVLYWNNTTPVFCDVDPDTYNLDPKHIESLISPKTTGIMPVHTFGNPCDIEHIERIAKYHGLKVIYDAAHAFGVEINGNPIGNFGDATMFSFHATKLFNTLEGGAVTCSDVNLNQRLRDLRNFGIRSEEEVISPGINAKMNEFQAAFGLLNLKKVKNTIEKRKEIFERYHDHFRSLPGLRFQRITHGTSYNYAYLTVEILPDQFGLSRDDVYICMRKEGIMVRKYFYPLCSNYPCYQALPSAKKDLLPNANRLASRILSLPLYSEMTEEDIDKIVEVFTLLYKHSTEIKDKINHIT